MRAELDLQHIDPGYNVGQQTVALYIIFRYVSQTGLAHNIECFEYSESMILSI